MAAPALLGRRAPSHPRDLVSMQWLALRTYYRDEVTLHSLTDDAVVSLPIRPRFSTDSLYALRSAAVRGLGACISSSWLVQEGIQAGHLVRLLPQWEGAPLPIHLVYPHSRIDAPRLSRFVETMRRQALF